MTATSVKITVPAGIPTSGAESLFPSSAQATAAAPSTPKVTFAPVNDALITQIMGYVSLGLTELGLDASNAPNLIYKWHSWLSRMNDWMKKNKEIYPRYLDAAPVKLSADLYFMSNIPAESEKIISTARIAPLGPLLPMDKNTMVRALQKGLLTCVNSSEVQAKTSEDLLSFVEHVNKIAVYAIQPQNHSVGTSMLVAPSVDVMTGSVQSDAVVPLPALGKLSKQNVAAVVPVVRQQGDDVIESFGNTAFRRRSLSKNMFMMWFWIIVLMMIIYFFVKRSGSLSSEPVTQIEQFGPMGPIRGGSWNTYQPKSISDFAL